MSNDKKQGVLAIDPGTRHIGFAFFEGKQLVHYGVKTISVNNSPNEKLVAGRRLILRLIRDFKPRKLVIEKTFFANNRNSALLNVLGDEIRALGKSHGLAVQALAANTVRKFVCENGSASKDEVAKVCVARFPELRPYLSSDRKWKEQYHRNMFDAVALGMTAEIYPLGNRE